MLLFSRDDQYGRLSIPTSAIVWSLEDCMSEDCMKEVGPIQTFPKFNKLIPAQQSDVPIQLKEFSWTASISQRINRKSNRLDERNPGDSRVILRKRSIRICTGPTILLAPALPPGCGTADWRIADIGKLGGEAGEFDAQRNGDSIRM